MSFPRTGESKVQDFKRSFQQNDLWRLDKSLVVDNDSFASMRPKGVRFGGSAKRARRHTVLLYLRACHETDCVNEEII